MFLFMPFSSQFKTWWNGVKSPIQNVTDHFIFKDSWWRHWLILPIWVTWPPC